jgi:hypothetical protein
MDDFFVKVLLQRGQFYLMQGRGTFPAISFDPTFQPAKAAAGYQAQACS